MHEDHAHSLLGESVEEFPLSSMGADVVGIDYDGVCTLHDGLILLGPVGPQDGGPDLESTLFVEGLGQKRAAGIKLVFTGPVAAVARNEDDVFGVLLLFLRHEKGTEQGEEEGEDEGVEALSLIHI
mgnify:CR=1 FL=1